MAIHGNETRNQHFVSRVEQKLNACNPGSASGKFRIYSYRILNRDVYQIELENPRGRQIESTLSMLDLFSFDIPSANRVRMNLESLFHKYEENIEVHTKGLLEKLDLGNDDIKTEIIDLFAAKLLNFIRNPFCIEKVLNTFPGITSLEPTDPVLQATYHQIITGKKPQQTYLCDQLGISNKTYIDWLKLLFMLLMPVSDDQPNFFESMIKALFERRDLQAAAFVFQYDNDYCLLSDRGFCQPIPDGPHMSMSFNLCSNAFVDFCFADARQLVQGRAPDAILDQVHADWIKHRQLTLEVRNEKNNLEILRRYNRRAIEQCRDRVYFASKNGPVL